MAIQKVQVKTISKLPDCSDHLGNRDLFWVSQKGEDGLYNSYKTDLESIIRVSEEKISSDIKTAFGLADMDVNEIKISVDNLYGGNVLLKGLKTFDEAPLLANYKGNEDVSTFPDNRFIVRGNVEKLIDNSGSYIGQNSSIIPYPNNNTPLTNEDDDLMIWRIPDGYSDSTDYVNESGIKNPTGVECDKTGQLVVYGWLADGGGVLPQEAWVALYGKIANKNSTGSDTVWTILQLQPWIVSERSKVIQYVGFNIPVKQGLCLKIKTGFKVSSSATATNSGNSLTFENVQPNTFVGYIVS